jgi:predicted Na+-dependent transporter
MESTHRSPFGGFLDDLPKALYVLAHVAFFGVGIGLWAHARNAAFPHPGALLFYVASQAVFFGFFANWMTLKMAVLAEQTLMLIMVCLMAAGTF